MASTNVLQINPTQANTENDASYLADANRTGGFGTGAIIPGPTFNKMLYQLSTVAAALCGAFVAKGYSPMDTDLPTLTAVFAHLVTSADQTTSLIKLPYGIALTFDASASLGWDVLLTGNVVASSLINAVPGQLLKFVFRQDAAGSRSVTWPANFFGTGGQDPTPNSVTIQFFLVTIDGTVRSVNPPMVS